MTFVVGWLSHESVVNRDTTLFIKCSLAMSACYGLQDKNLPGLLNRTSKMADLSVQSNQFLTYVGQTCLFSTPPYFRHPFNI